MSNLIYPVQGIIIKSEISTTKTHKQGVQEYPDPSGFYGLKISNDSRHTSKLSISGQQTSTKIDAVW